VGYPGSIKDDMIVNEEMCSSNAGMTSAIFYNQDNERESAGKSIDTSIKGVEMKKEEVMEFLDDIPNDYTPIQYYEGKSVATNEDFSSQSLVVTTGKVQTEPISLPED